MRAMKTGWVALVGGLVVAWAHPGWAKPGDAVGPKINSIFADRGHAMPLSTTVKIEKVKEDQFRSTNLSLKSNFIENSLPIVGPLLGVLFTAVFGNHLVQSWQQKNWEKQQLYLGREKEYQAFVNLSQEIASLCGARWYSMFLLAKAVKSDKIEDIETLLLDYKKQLVEWNSNINGFYIRLTLYQSRALSVWFESYIQDKFVSSGRRLEALVRARRKGELKVINNELVLELNELQGALFNYNRDLLASVNASRAKLYYGFKLSYSPNNIEKYTNLELVKALFVTNVDAFSVSRSALNFGSPGSVRV